VVVVGSRSQDKAKAFIEQTGLKHAQPVKGYDAVLDFPGIQAAYIPLPTTLHVEWVRKAAAKGLHIVLEKPISLTDEDTAAIVKAVRDAGVALFDGTMWMHHPRTALMQSALEEVGGAFDVSSIATFKGNEDFLKNDVRVKKDADALGCLGDVGW
jgi:predicted dehydrogenase